MEFLAISDEALTRAAEILRRGGLAAFPTETVYGLGGDAFNAAALAKIFEAKGRPRFDPLIVHIASVAALEKIADLSLLDDTARKKLNLLAERLWPGPLTLILPKQKTVPDIATSGLSTVAVRFPDHSAARKLINLSTGALAAPSANPFGYLSPTRAEHVRDQLGSKVDIILDGGPSKLGLESTVLDICGPLPRILRPGATPKEAIEALTGPLAAASSGAAAGGAETGPVSPGLLKSHYAPRTPLSVYSLESLLSLPRENTAGGGRTAILFFDGPSRDAWLAGQKGGKPAAFRVLSEKGGALEAAARLFETLHELDRSGFSRILAQLAPEAGLGAAINDRLRRAGSGC
ncbi:MAG: threonylcarbamoyl-AMP synthase [Treponema sp.]|jgi:L-threonylcarbamoyladenylate synthase|nr:threonylcarbamoyl-AMP synthase [Treponema sp.]